MSFMNSSGFSGYPLQQPANANKPFALLTFCKTISSPLSVTLNSSPTSTPTFLRISFGIVTWYFRVTLVFDANANTVLQKSSTKELNFSDPSWWRSLLSVLVSARLSLTSQNPILNQINQRMCHSGAIVMKASACHFIVDFA